MADKTLSSIVGGSGFLVEEITDSLTHSLSSATPLVVPAVEGKKIRIDFLMCQDLTGIDNVTVTAGNREIVTSILLNRAIGAGFCVAGHVGDDSGTGSINYSGAKQPIELNFGEDLTVSTSEAAAKNITYAISLGS